MMHAPQTRLRKVAAKYQRGDPGLPEERLLIDAEVAVRAATHDHFMQTPLHDRWGRAGSAADWRCRWALTSRYSTGRRAGQSHR
ncbi:hypothetical protein M8494_28745 [Serratia ureilytica]